MQPVCKYLTPSEPACKNALSPESGRLRSGRPPSFIRTPGSQTAAAFFQTAEPAQKHRHLSASERPGASSGWGRPTADNYRTTSRENRIGAKKTFSAKETIFRKMEYRIKPEEKTAPVFFLRSLSVTNPGIALNFADPIFLLKKRRFLLLYSE